MGPRPTQSRTVGATHRFWGWRGGPGWWWTKLTAVASRDLQARLLIVLSVTSCIRRSVRRARACSLRLCGGVLSRVSGLGWARHRGGGRRRAGPGGRAGAQGPGAGRRGRTTGGGAGGGSGPGRRRGLWVVFGAYPAVPLSGGLGSLSGPLAQASQQRQQRTVLGHKMSSLRVPGQRVCPCRRSRRQARGMATKYGSETGGRAAPALDVTTPRGKWDNRGTKGRHQK